ncbi:MAG: peptidylprolyl isomerase [Bacteroidia bacterium]|nr:peptidylprolyl isomerase [Bacteroidia bacterium]
MKNTIQENMAVYLSFVMYGKTPSDPNEILLENIPPDNPYSFLYGVELQLPEFEKQLLGKEEGAEFEICLSMEEAYGPYEHDLVVDLGLETFMVDGKFDSEQVKEGNLLQFYDHEGLPLYGKVLNVGAAAVKVDFNNPLAGYSLRYKGKVEKVRPATADELEHGHLHDGHHHH